MDKAYSFEEQQRIFQVHDAGPPCDGCYFCPTPEPGEEGEVGA